MLCMVTKKEKLMMIKQLGMTYILYYLRKRTTEIFSTPSGKDTLRSIYGNISLEDIILNWLCDEDTIIDYLDSAERDYKEKLKDKRQWQENTNQTDP